MLWVTVGNDSIAFVIFDVFLAGGASNTQWNSAKPSSASHPERDRTQKGQDPRLWGLWDCLQGKSHKE